MSELVIGANGFALPLNAMTRRIVVLGQSDTGKTNTVTDLVEEVLEPDPLLDDETRAAWADYVRPRVADSSPRFARFRKDLTP